MAGALGHKSLPKLAEPLAPSQSWKRTFEQVILFTVQSILSDARNKKRALSYRSTRATILSTAGNVGTGSTAVLEKPSNLAIEILNNIKEEKRKEPCL